MREVVGADPAPELALHMLARWAGGSERVLASRFRLAGPVFGG